MNFYQIFFLGRLNKVFGSLRTLFETGPELLKLQESFAVISLKCQIPVLLWEQMISLLGISVPRTSLTHMSQRKKK